MKSIATTLFGFFLACAFISHLPSLTAAFVTDTDGNPVRNGGAYHILPVVRGRGGGIELAATGNETCPLTVVQSPFELSKGIPTRISSVFRIAFIHEELPLDLSFTSVPSCSSKPSEWTIVDGALPTGQPSVKLTGYKNTVTGSFKIKKSSPLDYKLVFCASNSKGCSNIGIHIDDNGKRHLVVTNKNTLVVHFKETSSSVNLLEAYAK